MGSVYRATDTRLGDRPVALKVLHAELLSHATARERMEREALALSRIRHANVVGIFDCFDVDGRLAIVLEFIPGGDLLGRVSQGAMPWRQAVDVMGQVLEGLGAIHDAGLVHRDIKTANVLMDGDVPKVADLGIAHDEATRGLTRTGVNPGTPEYMSPEQIQGHVVDARSDLYACGVVLFELLTGRLPFVGDSEFAVKKLHVDASVDLSLLPPEVPAGLHGVIARALAKAPAERFASAAEMATALKGAPSATAAAPPLASAPPAKAPPLASAPPAKAPPLASAPPPEPPPLASAPRDAEPASPAPPAPLVTDHGGATEGATEVAESRAPGAMGRVMGGALVALVLVAVGMWWMTSKKDREYEQAVATAAAMDQAAEAGGAAAPCDHAELWAGRHSVTTVVHGDRKSATGVNGFYDLVVDVDGCDVSMRVTKTGYTASGRRRMVDADKQQSGTLRFRAQPEGGGSAGGARVVLSRDNGSAPQDTGFELFITPNGELSGWWHYAGDSWDKAPFWGSLVGVDGHDDYPRHKVAQARGEASGAFDARLGALRRQGGAARLSFKTAAPAAMPPSAFLTRWAKWQSGGSYKDYAAVYAPGFEGIKRTSSGKVTTMSRQRWLNDRRTMFAKGQTVHVRDVREVGRDGDEVTVRFTQYWRSGAGTYKDQGDKELRLKMSGGRWQILREEMLSSRSWNGMLP